MPEPTLRQARAVLFDFGGTLDCNGVPWKERFLRLFRDEGLALAPDRFDRAFYDADDALVGTVPAELSYRETVMTLARGVAARLELTSASLPERVGERFWLASLTRLAANLPLLEDLHGRYRLGIVSNFYGNLHTVCRDAGIARLFGVIVDSARLGCTKPDPAIFRAATDALDITPDAALFVGDSLTRDIAGARALGMPGIWLAAEAGTEPEPGQATIHTLGALRELLL